MIKSHVLQGLRSSLAECCEPLQLTSVEDALSHLALERPKQAQFGDYAVNVSPLAKMAKLPPPKIAELVAQAIETQAPSLAPSLAGGFINFKIAPSTMQSSLVTLLKQAKPGQNQQLTEQCILLEYVSANPTGPLHIGHGRWMALGNSLARLLRHCGSEVWEEFYINDYGSQMNNIAHSLWYRCCGLLNPAIPFPEKKENEPYPFYPGEYVIDLAQTFLADPAQKVALEGWLAQSTAPPYKAPTDALDTLKQYAKTAMLAEQKALLERCGLVFDAWFSETDLHRNGQVAAMLDHLKTQGVTYEQDDALWFASSRFGDDQDRVLIKSDGSYTYLTADIAYHFEKLTRQNGHYKTALNIWGADHHGYIPRMKAAVEAMGFDPQRLEILLGQLVNLVVDGQRARMGKRKTMLTLGDLVDEVGVDAVRFWMVSKSQDTTLDFDVELATSSSDENPVFYVQYAHARCCSIFRNAFEPRLDTLSQHEAQPLLTQAEWQGFLDQLQPSDLDPLFESLPNEQAETALRELILKLDAFEDKLVEAASKRYPHVVVRYLLDLSADFHRFYNACRILVDDPPTCRARLVIIEAIRRVLAQGLELLGVSAPIQM